MSLASVLQTAGGGFSAASFAVDAVSQNVANLRTNGYKASRPVYATQGTSTASGSPADEVAGVRVVGLATDFTRGSLIAAALDDPTLVEAEAWENVGADRVTDEVVELSNTELGEELIELILASELFLANASVFETAGELLDELAQLGRYDG